MVEAIIVRDDNLRCAELEADDYQIVGRSWGARLRLTEPLALTQLQLMVDSVEKTGVPICELDSTYAQELLKVELATNADYPFTPATYQEPPVLATIERYWSAGKRVLGAIVDARFIGVVVRAVNDDLGDNDYASVA